MSRSEPGPDAIILPDDHIECATLREFAEGACAVIGAYKGATMRYLFEHGASRIIGVEPQDWAYELAVKNLLDQGPHAWELDRLALVPWITDADSKVRLYNVGTDGASIVGQIRGGLVEPDSVEVKAMNVQDWLGDDSFDFMVVNVEGAEYQLLPWLAGNASVLLVQYHGPPIRADIGALAGFDHCEVIGKGWHLYV